MVVLPTLSNLFLLAFPLFIIFCLQATHSFPPDSLTYELMLKLLATRRRRSSLESMQSTSVYPVDLSLQVGWKKGKYQISLTATFFQTKIMADYMAAKCYMKFKGYILNYIKFIPYLSFNFFQLVIKCARPQAEHIYFHWKKSVAANRVYN